MTTHSLVEMSDLLLLPVLSAAQFAFYPDCRLLLLLNSNSLVWLSPKAGALMKTLELAAAAAAEADAVGWPLFCSCYWRAR